MAHDEAAQVDGAHALTLKAGLMLWMAVILAVAGFAVIGSLLKLAPLYAGFLLAWYWAAVDKVSFKLAPATIVGGVCGVATAGLAQYAALNWGPAGGLAVLALIMLALLVQIMNWLPIAINPAYMLFLTVCGAPLLQGGESFRDVVFALLLGAVYFGGITYLGLRVFALVRRAPAVVVPEA